MAGYLCAVSATSWVEQAFLAKLARVRVEKGITRHQLAQAVGISYESLSRLEREKLPNAPLWWFRNCAIAIALGVELDEILDEREFRWRWTRRAPDPPPAGWLDR